MVIASFSRSTSIRLTPRSIVINSPRVSSQRKWFATPTTTFNILALIFFFVSLILVLGCVIYLYLFRYFGRGNLVSEFIGPTESCNVFEGRWVRDPMHPLYNSSNCPFAERGFNCLANGRRDSDYLRWRWKPWGCDVPRFDVRSILESLRGKRVVFVGDSMSRTQWESLICMLMTGVSDPDTVYEVNGNKISKTIRHLGVQFKSFNLSVEFYRSVFLVQQGLPPKHGPKRISMVLKLDKMDEINRRWLDSDVLIFNSGHWWTPNKLFDMGCYFQAGGSLKLGMPIATAFKMALETWATWVDTMVNTNRTHVFFRTFEPSHWSGSKQNVCEVVQHPMPEAREKDWRESADIIAEVVAKFGVPVTILNVTSMGASRSDAHIGTWNYPSAVLDCSHWCLPGVPDAWNELVFSYLLTEGWR